MGKLNKGIFGGVTGKVGNLVGYTLNGKDVVRLIGKNDKPASLKQLASRQAVKVTGEFLNPVLSFINIGFAQEARDMGLYPHNMAFSYCRKNSLKGSYPNVEIDFSKVLFAKGNGLAPQNPAVAPVAEGLKFTWDVARTWPEHTDRVMMLAYFPGLGKASFVRLGAARSAGVDLLVLEPELQNAYKEVYMAFVAEDLEEVSNSVYLGGF